MRMFKENRERLCERLRADPNYQPGSVILLEGGVSEMRHSSDHEPVFRQVSKLQACCNPNDIEFYPRQKMVTWQHHPNTSTFKGKPVWMLLIKQNPRYSVNTTKCKLLSSYIYTTHTGPRQDACKTNSDHSFVVFLQESFFHYLFGITEPDCYGAVDVDTARCTIFMPRLPDVYAVWMGRFVQKTQNNLFYPKVDWDGVY